MSNRTCLLADDHPAVLAFVRGVIEEYGLEIVAVASTGPEALALAHKHKPSVALIDLRMPGVDGFRLITDLQAALPALHIGVYTAEADAELAQGALRAGAQAVVLKDAPVADLTRVLAALESGSSYLDPALAGETLGGDAATSPPRLTDRELEVLELLAEGKDYQEIGDKLSLGPETVRTHVRKACRRLNASTRTQVVATALRLGLIE
jgi:two-component system, NarL family, response regulator DesR